MGGSKTALTNYPATGEQAVSINTKVMKKSSSVLTPVKGDDRQKQAPVDLFLPGLHCLLTSDSWTIINGCYFHESYLFFSLRSPFQALLHPGVNDAKTRIPIPFTPGSRKRKVPTLLKISYIPSLFC